MDPTNTATPILRIQPLSAYQSGGQQQRTPFSFTQGQMLQGIVSAKSGANQFTIDIGGRQILAESTAQLQVGQKLNLQVATLTPQVELQIVNSGTTINRMIGNAIHLIGQQTDIFPGLTDLAGKSTLLPQLSTNSKETLQVYANSIANQTLSTTTPQQLQAQLSEQLLSRALESFTAQQGPNIGTIYEEIGTLLQQLSQISSLPNQTAQQATTLAAVFTQISAQQSSSVAPLPSGGTVPTALTTAESAVYQLNQTAKLYPNNPQIQNLISRLIPLLQENPAQPAMQDPLQQLISLLAKVISEQTRPEPLQLDGKQLQQFVDRLGINMERLLAEGNPDKASQTLKFALLELSQQFHAGNKSTVQADQIIKSIELYQNLQIRLANESLSFVPLPFSFLNQGYLLIDADRSKRESDEKSGQSEKTAQLFELHLQLEGLGNLQIDIRQQDGQVALKFLTEDTERAKFIAGFRNELEKWLTAASLESAQFLVGAKEPVKSLLEIIMSGATGMVDTKA